MPPYCQRMNILFLDQFSEMGGAQRGLLDVLRAVQQRGWKSHVLVPGGGPLVEQLRERNIPVEEIPCGPYRAGSKSAADVLRFARDRRGQQKVIERLLAKGGFDLIYVNGPRVLPAAASVAGRIPILFHLHSHIMQATARRLLLTSARRADITLVACSRSAADSAAGMVPAERTLVIANGIEEIPFQARRFDGAWHIGMVGRISPEKGQMEFVQAAARLGVISPRWALRSAARRYSQRIATTTGFVMRHEGWEWIFSDGAKMSRLFTQNWIFWLCHRSRRPWAA